MAKSQAKSERRSAHGKRVASALPRDATGHFMKRAADLPPDPSPAGPPSPDPVTPPAPGGAPEPIPFGQGRGIRRWSRRGSSSAT